MRVIQLPSALVLKHIADCLEVSADYLLGDGEQTIKDTALFDQFKQIDSLNEQDKNALVQVIENYLLAIKTKRAFA